MAKEKVGDVRVEQTGNKEWGREVVFRRGEWSSWDDAIRWLEEKGEADNELTPGEAVALHNDLVVLRDRGMRFTRNPDEAYKLAHEHRHPQQHAGRS